MNNTVRKMAERKKKIISFLPLILVLLIWGGFAGLIYQRHLDFLVFPIESFQIPEKIKTEGFPIKVSAHGETEDTIQQLETKLSNYPCGTYHFVLSYETDSKGNTVEIISESTMDETGKLGVIYAKEILQKENEVVRIPVSFEADATNVCLRVVCNTGTLQINELVIRNERKYTDPILFFLMGSFFLIGGYVLFVFLKKQKKELVWENILVVLFFAGVTTLPFLNDFLIDGHDLKFHLARIEGMSYALKQGQFPVRINPIQNNGYGYASSVMYPQLFLYFPAFLRIAGMSLMNCYKILMFFINVSAAVCSFLSFQGVWKRRDVAIIGCAAYMMCLYRMDNLYVRAAVGEALAMAFLPLIFWGMYEILWGEYRKWPIAALGFSLVIQSHILSTEIYVVITAVAFVISMYYTNKKKERVLATVKAAGMTLLWNLFFIVPFLDYFMEAFVVKGESDAYLPDRTIYLSQMFSNFLPHMPEGNTVRGGTRGQMPVTLGLISLISILFFEYVCRVYREDIETNPKIKWGKQLGRVSLWTAGSLSLVMLWIVPWDVTAPENLFRKFGETVQFLWRLLGPASFFLCIVLMASTYIWGAVNAEKQKNQILIWIFLTLLLGWPTIDATTQSETYPGKEYIANMNMADYNYFYQGDNPDVVNSRGNRISFSQQSGLECYNFSKEGLRLECTIVAREAVKESYVEVPFYFYPGYQAWWNGEKLSVLRGDNGVLRVELPELAENEEGYLYVEFCQPLVWKIAYMISAVGIILTVVFWKKHTCTVKKRDRE